MTKRSKSDIINKLSVEAQRNLERRHLRGNGSSQNVYLTKLIRCDKIERLSQKRERGQKTSSQFVYLTKSQICDIIKELQRTAVT